jgi:hypothetical protein
LTDSVLVLNRYFLAIQVTNVKEAIINLVSGKAKVVDKSYVQYDLAGWEEKSFEIRLNGTQDYPGILRSPSTTLVAPQVIIIPDCEFNNPAIKTVRYSRRNLFQRDRYTCQYCRRKFDKKNLTIDHVTPKSQGGRSEWTNVVACCKGCNTRKGDKTLKELGWKLAHPPTRPKWRSHIGKSFRHEKKEYWETFLG